MNSSNFTGPLIVACLKWGNPYPPEYVNVLRRAVADNLSYPHRFVCVTDSSEGLAESVEVMTLPEIPIERSNWRSGFWPKLSIFKPGMFPAKAIVLYLDVDILIDASLDPLVELIDKEGGLRIVREWNPDIWRALPVKYRPDRGGNSSVVGFRSSEQPHLWSNFVADPMGVDRAYRIDQNYITRRGANRRYWPEDWFVSFRRMCVPHWPFNHLSQGVQKVAGSKVYVFHGRPNPTEMVADGDYRWGTKYRYGYGPVPWVQAYWRKYAEPCGDRLRACG